MQNAETVLDILRERGRRGLPCDELYRQLFNPQLYLMAYGRLYSNQGAMTPGVDAELMGHESLATSAIYVRGRAPQNTAPRQSSCCLYCAHQPTSGRRRKSLPRGTTPSIRLNPQTRAARLVQPSV